MGNYLCKSSEEEVKQQSPNRSISSTSRSSINSITVDEAHKTVYSKLSDPNLNINKLNEIHEVLKLSGFPDAKWSELGFNLKLTTFELRNIEEEYLNQSGISRCLLECLALWLQRTDTPTWSMLANALASMNMIVAANKVNDLINLQKYSTKLSQVAIQAQQLYTEGIIDIQMLTEVENTGGYFKDSLFDVVCSAMFKDKNVLRKFANVLSKSNSTASLANDIIRDCDINDLIKEKGQLQVSLEEKNKEILMLQQALESASSSKEKDKINRKMLTQIDQLNKCLESKEKNELEKEKEIEILQDKITSLSIQLLEKEEQIQKAKEYIESIRPIVLKIAKQGNTVLPLESPPMLTEGQGDNSRVEWSDLGVYLTSPDEKDWKCVFEQLLNEKEKEEIKHVAVSLYNSSPEITSLITSQIHQTKIYQLFAINSPLDVDCLHHICQLNFSGQLQMLYLEDCGITTDKIDCIMQSLAENIKLELLYFRYTELTTNNMNKIIKLLEKNQTLQKVCVDKQYKTDFQQFNESLQTFRINFI